MVSVSNKGDVARKELGMVRDRSIYCFDMGESVSHHPSFFLRFFGASVLDVVILNLLVWFELKAITCSLLAVYD